MSAKKIEDVAKAIEIAEELFRPAIKNRVGYREELKLKERVKAGTILGDRKVNAIWKDIVSEERKSFAVQCDSDLCIIRILETTFKVTKRNELMLLKSTEDGDVEVLIANGLLTVESIETVEDPMRPDKYIVGKILMDKEVFRYRIPMGRFSSNLYLAEELNQAAGTKFNFYEHHISDLRLYAKGSGSPSEITISRNFGFDGDKYYTPSLVITSDGIFENREKLIEMPPNTLAQHLDFKREDDSNSFNELLKTFIENFLKLRESYITYFCLAHAFVSMVHARFKSLPPPILWLCGRTGDGKSFLLVTLCNLFGDFPEVNGKGSRKVSWTASPKYIAFQGMYFQGVPYLVDDFKNSNINHRDLREISQMLANVYDGSGRGTLSRNRSANEQAVMRGLLFCTGEDLPPVDAAVMARMAIRKYPIAERNLVAGEELRKIRTELPKIPPHFLHWFLNQDQGRFEGFHDSLKTRLQKKIMGCQNDLRISILSAEYGLGFHLLGRFLVARGLWTMEEAESRDEEFEKILEDHVVFMAGLAQEGQGCHIFLRALQSLVGSGEALIHGIHLDNVTETGAVKDPGTLDGRSGRYIGFVKRGADHDNTVYIDPEMAINSVERFLRAAGSEVGFSKMSIGQQLKDEGYFSRAPEKGNVLRVRWNQTLPWVWPIRPEALGLVMPESSQSMPSSQLPRPSTNADGLI
jgi:hypothetical protein